MVTGTVTKNFSRGVNGQGYVLDTTLTIGYDTPWRQVEAMLIEAAQTALAASYPEYRLVTQTIACQPQPRGVVVGVAR